MTAFARVRSIVHRTREFRTSPTTVTVGPWSCVCRAFCAACCWPAKKAARARASALLLETQLESSSDEIKTDTSILKVRQGRKTGALRSRSQIANRQLQIA